MSYKIQIELKSEAELNRVILAVRRCRTIAENMLIAPNKEEIIEQIEDLEKKLTK